MLILWKEKNNKNAVTCVRSPKEKGSTRTERTSGAKKPYVLPLKVKTTKKKQNPKRQLME